MSRDFLIGVGCVMRSVCESVLEAASSFNARVHDRCGRQPAAYCRRSVAAPLDHWRRGVECAAHSDTGENIRGGCVHHGGGDVRISDSASQGNLKKLLARKQWKKVLSRVMLIAVVLVGCDDGYCLGWPCCSCGVVGSRVTRIRRFMA